jgi:hypothetical protein
MQTTVAMLAVVTTCLPEIQRTLGQARWPAFADRLRGFAATFQDLASEADLTRAVDELMGFLYEDEQVSDLITEIELADVDTRWLFGDRHHPSNREPPPVIVKLDTVANRFFLLCEHADLIAAGDTLDEITARSDMLRYKRLGAADQHRVEKNSWE